MKKVFIAFVMCLFAFVSNAGNWETFYLDDGGEVQLYLIDDFGGAGYYSDLNELVVNTDGGVFNFDEDTGYIPNVTIKLYGRNNKMIAKYTTNKFRAGGTYMDYAVCRDTKVNNKVIDFIKNKRGYVQFIVHRYNLKDFIIKIPCFSN